MKTEFSTKLIEGEIINYENFNSNNIRVFYEDIILKIGLMYQFRFVKS